MERWDGRSSPSYRRREDESGGLKKESTQEAVDVEALIMRLTFKEATYSIA